MDLKDNTLNLKDKTLELILDPATISYLKMIAATGLYGSDATSVAIGLVDEGIRRAVAKGFIKTAQFAAVP